VGLVTVALLTLAPLALRPVRLACLIHAANVHSEPGSNPSKSVEARAPEGAEPRSSPNGSRISDWSHRAGPGPGHAPTVSPPRCMAGAPVPTADTSQPRRPRSRRPQHHAGFPQG